jgi:hypothetical protein
VNIEAFVPPTVMLVMFSVAVPLFFMCSTTMAGLLRITLPSPTPPEGVNVTAGLGPMPVPDNADVCVPALFVTVKVVDSAPAVDGEKLTIIVQLVLAAKLVPQVPPTLGKSAVFPPTLLTDMLVIGDAVVLLRVKVLLALDEPSDTEPKLILEGVNVTEPPATNSKAPTSHAPLPGRAVPMGSVLRAVIPKDVKLVPV